MGYRPWGLANWILPRCPVQNRWDFLGCIATGERSLATWHALKDGGFLRSTQFLRIRNKPSRYDAAISAREDARIAEFETAGGSVAAVARHELLEDQAKIVAVIEAFLGASAGNVVLDVSALPKRFFFPFLKFLLREPGIRNLLVTYTSPIDYTSERLAENVDQWDHLPLFSGSYAASNPEMMIVNVGFEGLGLQDQIDHGAAHLPIKLLVPFPAPPQASRRTWELVRRLQKYRAPETFSIYRTDSKDVGDAFDRILSITGRGQRYSILAPFGPKPISVAMAIFATLTESQVFYTQPTVYHPDYSHGVGQVGGQPAVWTYCIRLDGSDYYYL